MQYGEASHFASKEQVLEVASRTLGKDWVLTVINCVRLSPDAETCRSKLYGPVGTAELGATVPVGYSYHPIQSQATCRSNSL